MSHNLKHFLKGIGRQRKVIVGLDNTLWNCTVNKKERQALQDMEPHVHPETQSILKQFQENGNSICIASRNPNREKCLYFIDIIFRPIDFHHIAIYPTPELKTKHINDCHKNTLKQPHDFILIDSSPAILTSALQLFPNCIPLLSTGQLRYNVFKST